VGQINGTKLFYEVWNVNAGLDLHYTSLLLWTDTTSIDSIDFCFDVDQQTDSVYITVTREDTSESFATTSLQSIPTLFQALIRAEYNDAQYYRFNDPNFSQKIYIKGNKLYLIYVHRPRMEESGFIVTYRYRFRKGGFELRRERRERVR
jgi:hypothetical protein